MTKPANFPGRKNARRVKALYLTTKKDNAEAAAIEAANLRSLIMPQVAAEGIRTKKHRGLSGRLTLAK